MKTSLKALTTLLLISFVFFSCKKDSTTGSASSWSKNTVEQDKALAEQSGIDLVKTMDEMQTTPTADAAESLNTKMKDSKKSLAPGVKVYTALAMYTDGKIGTEEMFKALKYETAVVDPTLQDEYNEAKATYEWNFTTNTFDSIGNTSAIVFKFPAKADGTTNNAVLTVSGVTSKRFNSDIVQEDLPTSVNVDLKIDNVVVSSYSFIGVYKTNGIPESITSTLTVHDFSLNVTLKNMTSSASMDYSFKKGTKILIAYGASANGNFSQENIDMYSETNPENILHTANMYIQVMNHKMDGTVNFKELYLATDEYDPNLTDKEQAEKDVTEINKYISVKLINASNNTVVAKAEAYAKNSPYESWTFDPITYEYKIEMIDDYDSDLRFVFADGTKQDAETFMEDGFNGLIDEMNAFITNLNEKYGFTMEPIQKEQAITPVK